MLLYLACLWRWSIASAGDDEDIRQSECGVARLSSCLRVTSISCMLWFLVVGSLSWGLFREALLYGEKFGVDASSLLGCGVRRRSSPRMASRRSPGAGVPQRGPGLYAVPPCGDVWTCFSRASRMSLVISCLCIVLSVTLICADVLNEALYLVFFCYFKLISTWPITLGPHFSS